MVPLLLLLVQLLHAGHELEEVLHSDEFAVELVVALSEPNLEEGGNIHENTKEADENGVQHRGPEEDAELVVQDENAQGVSHQDEHVIVESLLLVDVLSHQVSRLERCCPDHFVSVLLQFLLDFK